MQVTTNQSHHESVEGEKGRMKTLTRKTPTNTNREILMNTNQGRKLVPDHYPFDVFLALPF